MNSFPILKISFKAYDYIQILDALQEAIQDKKKITIAPLASHPVVLGYLNQTYERLYNSFDFILPDSFYTLWALNFLYKTSLSHRIYGPELFRQLCIKAQKEQWRVFLCGNDMVILKKKLSKLYPRLIITGVYELKGKKIINKEILSIKETVQKTKPQIFIIGLGTPSQHILIQSLDSVDLPLIAVGAAFDFVINPNKKAPSWISENGFEWLYRLCKEPKRLWKRYVIYGPLFILLVLKQKLFSIIRHG